MNRTGFGTERGWVSNHIDGKTSASVKVCESQDLEDLLSTASAVLTAKTTFVHAGIGDIATQWDMREDDISGNRGRKAEKEGSCLHSVKL